ncbi:MAG: FHA domain-containing protein [Pseudobdellovibrionaceae bacterium]
MTAAPVLARTLKYKLTVVAGGNAGQSLQFEKPVVTIGRGPENDLVFANDPKISRTHAEIRMQLGQIIIRNTSDRNFILVNGEKVVEKTIIQSATLQLGDTLLEIKPIEEAPQLPPPQMAPVSPVLQKQNVQLVPTQAQAVTYSAPTPVASQVRRPRPSNSVSSANKDNRLRFYGIIAVVGLIAYFLLSGDNGSNRKEVQLRTEGDVARAMSDSAAAVQELRRQKETKGQDSLQYKAAQEHYIKGFRDYRQGQYARAKQSFQAALSFYPAHELARKYYLQAERKLEAQIDFHMSQGRKYYQKQNYKMCQSSFASVMIMVKDPAKLKYREAKQLYEECSLRREGGL